MFRWSKRDGHSMECIFLRASSHQVCVLTHIHYFLSLSFLLNNFFDRPILPSNRVSNPSSCTWPCQKLRHRAGAWSSNTTLTEHISVYRWRTSTGMVVDMLILGRWLGSMESCWILINIVSNAEDATVSGRKKLQTRITHNDGVIIFYFFSMVIQSKYMIRRYMVACHACYDWLSRIWICL